VSSSTTLFGITKDNPATAADESGYVGIANPTTPADYTFTAFSRSQGDADGDDIENDLDTCPLDVNEGNPRVAGDGDNDNDGIDNVCDPTPDEAKTDHDGDVYLNRGDNCPLLNNPDNNDSDGDRIGDACDPNPDTPNGESVEVYVTDTVTIEGVLQVQIDIKPRRDPNTINPKSGGRILVAILTTAYFNALTVDPDSALLEGAPAQPRPRIKDADHDGDLDLLLRFKIRETDLVPGQTEACLIGETYFGEPIVGCDSVRTVP